MKIHYFQIEIQGSPVGVADLLDDIRSRPLGQRERRIQEKDVFLERCSKVSGSYEMEFTQRRTQNGPGHSQPGKQTTDFPLAQGAGFGEQAAAIWSPRGYLAAQYNHYGVRPSGIRAYLERFLGNRGGHSFDSPAVLMRPVIDQGVLARLYRSEKQSRFECAIAAEAITPEMARANVALGTVLGLSNEMSAGRVEFAVSFGEGKRGGRLHNIVEAVESLLRFDEHLSRLKVNIKEDLDTATEVLDLLEHRETDTVPDNQLQMSSGRRIEYSSRINAIRSRFEPWLSRR